MDAPKIETKFQPGTVVLQYVDDGNHYVGVVVGDHMAEKLNPHEARNWKTYKSKLAHICLVLSWFGQNWSRNKIFEEKSFPRYAVGRNDCATPTDLAKEFELYQFHATGCQSRGLIDNLSLQRSVFGFNDRQLEILQLVYLVQQYMRGQKFIEFPRWMGTSNFTTEDVYFFYRELDTALRPRE